MREEKVFPAEEPSDESIIVTQYDEEDTDDEEFFDPLPDIIEEEALENPIPVIELTHSKKKAMLELRCLVEDAILSNKLYGKKNKGNDGSNNNNNNNNDDDDDDGDHHEDRESLRDDVKIWGVPLLPSKGHEGTDIVLMKFLKAKDYKSSEAFQMLRNTMKWRRDHKIDDILDEEFNPGLQNMWSEHGRDKEGRLICYYKLGALKDREMRHKLLGSAEKYEEFTRWRIQCVERGVRKILFKEGAVNSILQIVDLKNAPATAMREVQWINRKMLTQVQENYPGLIHKNLVIQVPVWFMAFHALHLSHLTHRSRNKVVFVRSGKVTYDTLLKYITPENLPVQYGGLNRENDPEFSTDDKVLEVNVKANGTTQIQIPANEANVTVTWDTTVVGHEVTYKEEFIPTDDCSYKVLLQKEKKMVDTIRNSFHIREPGNIVITIGNGTFKKRKAFYRYKSKPSVPLYMFKK